MIELLRLTKILMQFKFFAGFYLPPALNMCEKSALLLVAQRCFALASASARTLHCTKCVYCILGLGNWHWHWRWNTCADRPLSSAPSRLGWEPKPHLDTIFEPMANEATALLVGRHQTDSQRRRGYEEKGNPFDSNSSRCVDGVEGRPDWIWGCAKSKLGGLLQETVDSSTISGSRPLTLCC